MDTAIGVHSEFSPTLKPMVTTGSQVKLIAAAEAASRKEKGLCFNCKEKFTLGISVSIRFLSL